jgi:hypothetical protein
MRKAQPLKKAISTYLNHDNAHLLRNLGFFRGSLKLKQTKGLLGKTSEITADWFFELEHNQQVRVKKMLQAINDLTPALKRNSTSLPIIERLQALETEFQWISGVQQKLIG